MSIDAITSGEKPGGVSTITKSYRARRIGYSSTQEVDRDRAGLVGPDGAISTRSPDWWWVRKSSTFSASSVAARDGQVVDRPLGRKPERRPTSPNCRSTSTITVRWPCERERDARGCSW